MNREGDLEKIRATLPALDQLLSEIANSKSTVSKLGVFQTLRYKSIHRYFKVILQGHSKTAASVKVANSYWGKENKSCRAQTVRNWAETYLMLGTLPEHQREKHKKSVSILDDEDIKSKACQWLRSIAPKDRKMQAMIHELEKNISPQNLGVPVKIPRSTLTDYVHDQMGFSYKKQGQEV